MDHSSTLGSSIHELNISALSISFISYTISFNQISLRVKIWKFINSRIKMKNFPLAIFSLELFSYLFPPSINPIFHFDLLEHLLWLLIIHLIRHLTVRQTDEKQPHQRYFLLYKNTRFQVEKYTVIKWHKTRNSAVAAREIKNMGNLTSLRDLENSHSLTYTLLFSLPTTICLQCYKKNSNQCYTCRVWVFEKDEP